MTILVSIITPSFNSVDYIQETIDSIQNQSYANIEHIVIDGGSTDGTLGVIKQNPQIKLVSEPDDGMYDAVNKGLHLAKGQIVAYLNSDDVYPEDSVTTAVACLSQSPQLELVYGDCEIIDSCSNSLYVHKAPQFNWDFFVLRRSLLITQPSAFWSRSVHEKYGYFNTKYKYSSDYDFFMRVFRGGNIQHTGKVMSQFRCHDQSLSQTLMTAMKSENKQIWDSWHVERDAIESSMLYESVKLRLQNWPLLFRKEYWQGLATKFRIYKF